MVNLLSTVKTADFSEGLYLGLAVGAAIILYILSRKYIRRR